MIKNFLFVVILLCSVSVASAEKVYYFKNIEISGPVVVNDPIEMFRDGGTMGGKIVDSKGTQLEFCLDGRMKMKAYGNQEPLHVFLFAMHPSSNGAIEVSVKGKEEMELYRMLNDWLVKNLPVEKDLFFKEIENGKRDRSNHRTLISVIYFLDGLER